jgi:hypothetical protein
MIKIWLWIASHAEGSAEDSTPGSALEREKMAAGALAVP